MGSGLTGGASNPVQPWCWTLPTHFLNYVMLAHDTSRIMVISNFSCHDLVAPPAASDLYMRSEAIEA